VVRAGRALSSAELPEKLCTKSLVEELARAGDRINYRLVDGTGPKEGWVSVRLKDKLLLEERPASSAEQVPISSNNNSNSSNKTSSNNTSSNIDKDNSSNNTNNKNNNTSNNENTNKSNSKSNNNTSKTTKPTQPNSNNTDTSSTPQKPVRPISNNSNNNTSSVKRNGQTEPPLPEVPTSQDDFAARVEELLELFPGCIDLEVPPEAERWSPIEL
ncbi:unnamed protein product, partial [Polarella glacialis]